MTVEEVAGSGSALDGGANTPRILPALVPGDWVARFRRHFGWRPIGETDRRTLVENIVISIENDVGGGGGDGHGREGGNVQNANWG